MIVGASDVDSSDHHSEYLARAVAALTPDGRRRVDELLDQLAAAVGGRERLVRFATARPRRIPAARVSTQGRTPARCSRARSATR